jgi:hypothetical protein
MENTELAVFAMEEVVHLPLYWNSCERNPYSVVVVVLEPAFVQRSNIDASVRANFNFFTMTKRKEWENLARYSS